MPATSQGFAAETLETIRTRLRAGVVSTLSLFGLDAPRWEPYENVTQIVDMVALESADLQEAISAAVANNRWNNAQGQNLIDIGELLGIRYDYGSESTVTLTVGAWNQGNVQLAAGSECQDVDTGTVWRTIDAVTIPANSTTTVQARSAEKGAFTAAPGKITRLLGGTAGWVSVTNATSATPGRPAASWDQYRAEISGSSYAIASRSEAALKARLEQIPSVNVAIPVFNSTFSPITVGGVSIPGYWLGVWIEGALTADDRLRAAALIYAHKGANINVKHPATTGADGFAFNVTTSFGQTRTVGCYYVRNVAFKVRVTVTDFEPGFSAVSQVEGAIEAAVAAYFSSRPVGDQKVRQNDLVGAVAGASGVGRATVELAVQDNPGDDPATDTYGAYTTNDLPVDEVDRPVLFETVVQ